MIGNTKHFGEAPRLGRRQLTLVFAVRSVVDNCPHPRMGQRLDIRAIKPAGNYKDVSAAGRSGVRT